MWLVFVVAGYTSLPVYGWWKNFTSRKVQAQGPTFRFRTEAVGSLWRVRAQFCAAPLPPRPVTPIFIFDKFFVIVSEASILVEVSSPF